MSPALETPVITVEQIPQFQQRLDHWLSKPEFAQKGILLSTDFDIAPLAEPSGLTRIPICWPIQDLNMFYVLQAPPQTEIPPHAHPSDVFRYIVEGSLTINGLKVEAGMWCVVRKGTQYAVSSKTGYKSIVAYRDVCEVTGAVRV